MNPVLIFVLSVIVLTMLFNRGFAAMIFEWLWKQKVLLAVIAAGALTIIELAGINAVIGFAPTVLQLGMQLVFAMLFMVVQFGAMMWIMSRPRVKWYQPGELTLTFDDFVGNDTVRDMLMEAVANIETSTLFRDTLHGEPSRGILMSGHPGTGKSYGARIIASVCGIPFCLVDAASLQSAFMGMGSMTVNNLYRKARGYARKYGACIIFLDELDAIGQSRSGQQGSMGMGMMGMMGGGSGTLLNTLLTNLDPTPSDSFINGIKRKLHFEVPPATNPYVLTIGATNLPERLDSALVRDGRMDLKIPFDLPDVDGRELLFRYEMKHVAVAADLDIRLLDTEPESEGARIVRKNIRTLALQTGGMSPAAIKTLVRNKAPQITARHGRTAVAFEDVVSARRTRSFGVKNPLKAMTEAEARRIALHEAGHAFMAMGRRGDVKVEYATIERRENALGLVAYSFENERYTHTYEEMLGQIESCLASRAVEIEIMHEPMSGFSGDLNTATRIAVGMINVYGMDDMLVSIPGIGGTSIPAASVNRILQKRMAICRALVIKHQALVLEIADALMEKKELDGDELYAIFHKHIPGGVLEDSDDVLAKAKEIEDAYYTEMQERRKHDGIGQDAILASAKEGSSDNKSEIIREIHCDDFCSWTQLYDLEHVS